MLQRLTDTFIAGVELLEAEGRAARREVSRTAGQLMVQAAAGVIVLVGLAMMVAGLTWALAIPLTWPGSLLTVGGATALAGAITAWSVRRSQQRRERTSALAASRGKEAAHVNGRPYPSPH